jgi:hypothetical protein
MRQSIAPIRQVGAGRRQPVWRCRRGRANSKSNDCLGLSSRPARASRRFRPWGMIGLERKLEISPGFERIRIVGERSKFRDAASGFGRRGEAGVSWSKLPVGCFDFPCPIAETHMRTPKPSARLSALVRSSPEFNGPGLGWPTYGDLSELRQQNAEPGRFDSRAPRRDGQRQRRGTRHVSR